jgi:hypothetical protein
MTVAVLGGDFVPGSVVRYNGTDRQTTYVDGHNLSVELTSEDLRLPGTYPITVFTPAPGGGTSNEAEFVVTQKPPTTPTLLSVVPVGGTAGTPGFLMQVYGTNFDQIAGVKFGGQLKSTIFVSPTELRITLDRADLVDPGVKTIQVVNGTSGLATNTINFVIESPVPSITSLSSTQTGVGSQDAILRVYGKNFIRSSVVLFNGSARPTQIIDGTELSATLSSSDLTTPGIYQITVQNPPSPGGTSNAVAYEVVKETLSLTGLPSYGATAGGAGFTITTYGTGFTPFSIVRWNGSDRPTAYISSHRLTAAIPASDVSSPGIASVTVFTPGADGGTSSSKEITIRTVAAPGITSYQAADIPANFLVYDSVSRRLLASMPATAASNANSIIALDPATAGVTGSVVVGGNPNVMGVSDDGQAVWVALDDAAQIRRVNLPSLTPSTVIAFSSGIRAEDIRVMPGRAGTIAVHKKAISSASSAGTAMFVDGNQLPATPPSFTPNNSIVFNESGTFLYGYNNENSEFGFHTLQVRPDGLAQIDATRGMIEQFSARIEYSSGRVYSTNGVVIDAERRLKVGGFTVSNTFTQPAVFPDSFLGRIFMLNDNTISVYDMNSFAFLGSVSLPTTVNAEHPTVGRIRLVRWGTDGLAFRDGYRVYILRTTLAAP